MAEAKGYLSFSLSSQTGEFIRPEASSPAFTGKGGDFVLEVEKFLTRLKAFAQDKKDKDDLASSLLTIAKSKNPNRCFRELLALGDQAAQSEDPATAALIFRSLAEGPDFFGREIPPSIRVLSQKKWLSLQGKGSAAESAASFIRNLPKDVFHWGNLGGMLVAGPDFNRLYFRGLAGLATQSRGLWTRGIVAEGRAAIKPFAAEVASFWGVQRIYNQIHHPDLIMNEPGSIMGELADLAATLGPLKLGIKGSLAGYDRAIGFNPLLRPVTSLPRIHQVFRPAVQQLGAYGGVISGTSYAHGQEWSPEHAPENIWSAGVASLIHLHFMGLGLNYFAGRRYGAWTMDTLRAIHEIKVRNLYDPKPPEWRPPSQILNDLSPVRIARTPEGFPFLVPHRGERRSEAEENNFYSQGQGRDSANYSGAKASPTLPKIFENGNPFFVRISEVTGILDKIPIIPVREELVQSAEKAGTPEDAIAKTIENHAKSMKKEMKPFMIYYGGEKKVDSKILKNRIERHFEQAFPDGFVIVVANPNARTPMAYAYRKKSKTIEHLGSTGIRANPKIDISTRAVREGAVNTKVGPRDSNPNLSAVKDPGTYDHLNPVASLKKAGERMSDFSIRNKTQSEVSEVEKTFLEMLQTMNSQKKDLAPGSWYIDITEPFIVLKPQEIHELSEGFAWTLETRKERSAIQESIFEQIKTQLIDKLMETCKKYPIPTGQVIHVKWKAPISAFVKIQEESDNLQVLISGTHIPIRTVSIHRMDLLGGKTIEISRPIAVSEVWSQTSDTETETSGETKVKGQASPHDERIRASDSRLRDETLEALQLFCEGPSGVFEVLRPLLDGQRGKFLPPRPIHLKLGAGKPDKDFLSDLVDFLREHPLLNNQTLEIKWSDSPHGLKARRSGGEITADLSDKFGDGSFIYSVVLSEGGQKNTYMRFHNGRE